MDKYDKQISELRKQQNAEREAEAEKLLPKYKNRWIGRCFKCRNSFGSDCGGWWLYARIIEVDGVNYPRGGEPEPNFRTFRFQKDTQGRLNIDFNYFEYRLNGWDEINPDEFMEEFNKMMAYAKKSCGF